jgi:protein-S-isoprenylcysteine O-methyltransferase Ste14
VSEKGGSVSWKQRAFFLLKGVVGVVVLTAALLALAGNPDYVQAFVFGLTNAFLLIALAIGFGDRIGLIRERMKPAPNAKSWDKILMAVFMPLAGAVIVVAALDGGRFRWTGRLPVWAYPPAVLAYCGAAAFHLWAILANEYYVSTVAVQSEKGHRTVERGPYRFVRHPGYTGIIVMEIMIPLLLGSLWGLVPAVLVSAVLVLRAALEDRALRQELPGYADYAARVRFRLVPGIW